MLCIRLKFNINSMWSKLGIGQKAFLLFSIVTLLPLTIINVIWLQSSKKQLHDAAASHQKIVSNSSAQRINQALDSKINNLISHSQNESIINFGLKDAQLHMLQLVIQDSDFRRIALVDASGNEQIVIKDREVSSELKNIKDTEAFKVVTLHSNEVLIGDVYYINQEPMITISVPLLSFSKVGEQNLTNAQALALRYGADSKGALLADISLESLFHSVTTNRLGNEGQVYIVDKLGKVLAHSDKNLVTSSSNSAKSEQVAKFINQPDAVSTPGVTTSEAGIMLLSTHSIVNRTRWAVIVQEPLSSIFAPARSVTKLATIIFVTTGAASLILSLLFSRNLIRPIKSLVEGTSQLGQGNMNLRIPIKSQDEIGVLADRFNIMAGNLRQLISDLKTESTKLNVVLDNVGEGIVATNEENRIVLANISAAVLAGTLPPDVIGKPFKSVFELTKNNQTFELKSDDSEVYKVYKEITFCAPSKRLHYLDIFINKIENDPNGIKNIITLMDKTEEKELEMMKLDFVSMAAHELRTPITAIRGYLGLISSDDKTKLSGQSKKSVDRARSSTGQLVGLISNLLNVSKIERGAFSVSLDKVDWSQIVQDSVQDHKFSAQEKNIDLRHEGPAGDVMILADEIAIREVINNLIANAINYTEVNGHVTISTHVENDRVITSVQDDGIGIPENAQKHLFTKFFRARGGLASGSGGTGLGLYISKSIVEMHGGTINMKSAPEKGSIFTISLPVYDEVKYNEARNNQMTGIKKRRGWVIKNTAR